MDEKTHFLQTSEVRGVRNTSETNYAFYHNVLSKSGVKLHRKIYLFCCFFGPEIPNVGFGVLCPDCVARCRSARGFALDLFALELASQRLRALWPSRAR